MYNNKYSDQLLPMITPEMLSHYPDQTCEILNKMGRLAQKSSTSVEGGGEGNLEDIVQTSTSYADGGVNIVTAYLSDGTTQDFQIRNGHQGSQGDPGAPGQDATIAVGTTTTLPAGSSATVTDSGTPSAAVLNFGIPKGDTGAAGADGQDGFSPIATVTKSGDTATISITDENGTTTATVTDGADGAAATISAGTTTTLPAGSSATVTNSGTSSAAVFDFGIPKGDTGAAGQDGADGFSPIATVSKVGDTATITITDENGTTTASVTDGSDGAPGAAATISAGTTTTLPAGSSATVTNSGTSSAAVFDFGIPQGATGTAATITVGNTSTLPAGSSATVTNSGTSSAAVFDFGIPKGDKGDTGNPGPKGDPGKGCPIGTIIEYAGSTLPEGYLACDGSAVSRTDYADLFDVIGTTYGAGDGSTTFNLPNLKGRVTVGLDTGDTAFDTLGETGGEKTHTLTIDEMPSHNHSITNPSNAPNAVFHSSVGTNHWFNVQGSGDGAHPDAFQYANPTIANKGGGGAHNNLQPYIVINYIIKYKDLAGTIAEVKDEYSTGANDVYSVDYINANIPTVNDATLTLTQNGSTLGTFTANSATNTTIDVPGGGGSVETTYVSGEGTDVLLQDVQGGYFKEITPKGDTKQGAGLPTGYKQVEYIQNTTNTYFSLPFALTGADTVTMDIQITGSANGWATLWCSRTDTQTNTFTSFVNLNTNEVRADYNTNQSSTSVTGPTSRHIYQEAKGNYFIDGVQKVTRSASTFTAPSTTTLLASNINGGTIGNNGYGKIYSFKVERNGVLLRNLVPAVRTSDSKVGLYDTMTGTFYANAGTGQFTAGVVSPTPAMPQLVQTVTGEQTINITGKNLLEITPSNHIVRGTYVSGANTDQLKITATGSDLYLNEVKAAGSTWDLTNQGNLIPCEYGETLYFNSGNASFTKNLVTEYDESKISLGYYGLSAASGSFTTRFNGCKYISLRIGYEPATVGTTYTLAPIVSKTSISGYEPYQSQTHTINLGKNLLDTTITQPGFINASGNYQANAASQASVFIEVLPNTTYTASATATYRYIGFAEYTSAKTFIGSIQQGGDTSSYSITTTAATKFIRVFYNKSTNITAQTLRDDKAQVEIGSARTDYILYADKIELCKIGDKQDYIYKDNGTWYLHKETAKIVDNGASGWNTSGATVASGVSAYVHTGLNIPDYTPGYVNMATLKTNWSDWTTGDGLQSGAAVFNSNNYYFKISTSTASTVAQLQTFLASAPLITYYTLVTAVNTQIIDASLLSQLNALDNAMSYKGDTRITVEAVSPDLPAILSVTAEEKSDLPTATKTNVGAVAVGDGLEVTEGGVLSLADNVVYSEDPGTPIGDVTDPYTYSTSETIIGTWIDGKPIYRKTFEFANLTPTANNSVNIGNHGIANFQKAIKIEAQYRLSWDTSTYFTADRLSAAGIAFHVESTSIFIDCAGSTHWDGQYTVTIYYTKTTD